MIKLINVLRKYTVENRNNNYTARCSWHEQRQQIYVLYENNFSNKDERHVPKTAANSHSGNNS